MQDPTNTTFLMTKPLLATLSALLIFAATTGAQEAVPFKGCLYNDEHKIFLCIDFYSQDVCVPDQDIFGELPGYLGNFRDSRLWLITSATITSPTSADIAIINDYGSEDLEATLTLKHNDCYELKQGKGSRIKLAIDGKWVKIPSTVTFERLSKTPDKPTQQP